MSSTDLVTWAVPQLSHILPLDEASLKDIVAYTESLSKEAAAEHLKNLLGDTPQAYEFISSFNSRRYARSTDHAPSSISAPSNGQAVSPTKSNRHDKKKSFNKLPAPRQPNDDGQARAGAYLKTDEDDYILGSHRPRKEPQLAKSVALSSKPEATQLPTIIGAHSIRSIPAKLPPSAAGPLISDTEPSRSSSPNPKSKAKINVSGGTSMRGQSSVIDDLDSAIRSLELSTNPTKQEDSKRRCDCMAQRHALLTAAPNCLNCGKIICVKEGIGPCTFCGKALLSSSEVQAMVRVLREERGKEKLEVNNASHRRAEVAKSPRPFSSMSTPNASRPTSDSESEKLYLAKEHRDRLLKYQADNARRTRIHDEAADFDTPDSGQSMWATPQERALQLKRQQKALREQEWNARPDYEKRKMVVSLDVVGGKAVKRMAAVERPKETTSDEENENENEVVSDQILLGKGGTFSKNPLLGELIRPIYPTNNATDRENVTDKRSTWRRVQDDADDNEQWILDGGAYGNTSDGRILAAEEHSHGW